MSSLPLVPLKRRQRFIRKSFVPTAGCKERQAEIGLQKSLMLDPEVIPAATCKRFPVTAGNGIANHVDGSMAYDADCCSNVAGSSNFTTGAIRTFLFTAGNGTIDTNT